MKLKNFTVTIISLIGIFIFTAIFKDFLIEIIGGNWFMYTGIITVITFGVYMLQNARHDDMGKRKRVMSGMQLVENENRNIFDHTKTSGNSFVDSMGTGFNLPNLTGFVVGILFILIGIII